MLKNVEKVVADCAKWIEDRAEEAKSSYLVIGISGGVDSAVVAAICSKTKYADRLVGVLMPCHSSQSSLNRGAEVAQKFKLIDIIVELDKAFSVVQKEVRHSLEHYSDTTGIDFNVDFNSNEAAGALRSCLRAPTLDYVGKLFNGIIIGTGNRDEDEVTRYFQKRGDGAVDISPIAKFHKSEIYQIAKYLGVPQSVIDAVPSADLWGPDSGQEDEKQLGITYQEVEWGIRFAEPGNRQQTRSEHFLKAAEIVAAGYPPSADTDRKLAILHLLAKMELTSRHKENPNLPVFTPGE